MTLALLTHNGVTQPIDAWAAQLGVSVSLLYAKRKSGLPVAQILAPPKRKRRGKAVWPSCTAIGCDGAAQSHTMLLCNRHVREARETPGPKCPRCKTFPPRVNGAICLRCARVVERRRKKPASRGNCPHPGCWRRAHHPNGYCEHHVDDAPRKTQSREPKRRCSRCGLSAVTTRGGGLCARHLAEAEQTGTLPPSRRGLHLIGSYRPVLPKEHRRGGSCSIAQCPRKAASTGLCWKHWREARNVPLCANCHVRQASGLRGKNRYCERCNSYRREHGRLPPARSLAKTKRIACSVPECGRSVYAHGLCSGHYQRQRHGRPILNPPLRPFKPRHRNQEV